MKEIHDTYESLDDWLSDNSEIKHRSNTFYDLVIILLKCGLALFMVVTAILAWIGT